MIDIDKLQALLLEERTSEWAVDGRYVYGNGTKYSFGDFEEPRQAALAVAAVNALPELLAMHAVAVAAMHLHALECDRSASHCQCDGEFHDFDNPSCEIAIAERAFRDACDLTCSVG